MTMLHTREVGRLWQPERRIFLPGSVTPRKTGHQALVTFAVRDGKTGKKTQAGYAAGVIAFEGLREKYLSSEAMQREFGSPEAAFAAMRRTLLLKAMGYTHNERVDNGSSMVINKFWGVTTGGGATSNSTVNAPTRIAVSNASGLAVAHGDQSLGTATANATTNEATGSGMARTGAITPTGVTASSALDGQFQLTIQNTFTATAAITIYGAALMDNTTAAFNMYAEATHTSAALQTNDTLQEIWTCKD